MVSRGGSLLPSIYADGRSSDRGVGGNRVLSKKMAAVPSKVSRWLKDGGGSSRITYGGRGYTGPTNSDGPKARVLRRERESVAVPHFRTEKGQAWDAMPKGI